MGTTSKKTNTTKEPQQRGDTNPAFPRHPVPDARGSIPSHRQSKYPSLEAYKAHEAKKSAQVSEIIAGIKLAEERKRENKIVANAVKLQKDNGGREGASLKNISY